MCGIAGFIDDHYTLEDAERLIDTMCGVIRHRGPDDQGTWVANGIALGMRRLAIIDRAGGSQPVFNEDKSILVVFNGEIYNNQQLHRDLQARGHCFQTLSDTETIVHAYEEYGDDCVHYLHGMFSFALWDNRQQRLLAARDRFGKKPFHYYWDGKRFIFGSEIKSILEAGIPRKINHIALDEYLVYRYVPTPLSLFQGITKLPAAHLLTFQDGQVTIKRYWELSFHASCQDDEATAIERTYTLLKDAVKARLVSEVPLGAFLSGGIDSSIVVALMSQMSTQPVKTFSIGFDEDDYSELPYARQVADHFQTEHHEFVVRPDLVSVLPQLVWAYDEPFGDASMLPTYYVSRLAKEHVTVVLTGDGGDEIFAGYQHYARERTISHIPEFIQTICGYGSFLLPDGIRGKKRLRSLLDDASLRYVQGSMLFPVGSRVAMYSKEYVAHVYDHNPFERQSSVLRAASHLDIVARMQHADILTYLPDDILVKVDRASMFNSLETRAPLLDQFLAEYIAGLPTSLRMHRGILKYLLKRVATNPPNTPNTFVLGVFGFAAPIEHWFRGHLTNFAYELLTSPQAQQRGIFNPQYIHNLLKAHTSSTLINHSEAIWALLCLELWFRTYIDQPPGRSEHVSPVSITCNS